MITSLSPIFFFCLLTSGQALCCLFYTYKFESVQQTTESALPCAFYSSGSWGSELLGSLTETLPAPLWLRQAWNQVSGSKATSCPLGLPVLPCVWPPFLSWYRGSFKVRPMCLPICRFSFEISPSVTKSWFFVSNWTRCKRQFLRSPVTFQITRLIFKYSWIYSAVKINTMVGNSRKKKWYFSFFLFTSVFFVLSPRAFSLWFESFQFPRVWTNVTRVPATLPGAPSRATLILCFLE